LNCSTCRTKQQQQRGVFEIHGKLCSTEGFFVEWQAIPQHTWDGLGGFLVVWVQCLL
jgi:hypothetical protein